MMAAEEAEVGDAFQTELASLLTLWELQTEEVCAFDIVEMERGSGVGGFGCDFDVAEFDVFALRMYIPVAGRSPNMLGSEYLSAFSCGSMAATSTRAPPTLQQVDVTDLQIFNGVIGDTRDD
jgi:hypothetical protein